MAPRASHAAAALVRLPPRPTTSSLPQQGFGRAGASLLAVRAAKDSDGFRRLVSEKPEWPAPAPAKREGLDGFGREASNGEEDGLVQGELAPWSVLSQLGVELDSDSSYTALVYGSSAIVAIWISSIVVSALESVPVQENRDELITRIGSIKRQVLGSRDD
ncbi:unnamed protein product [Triticum turgidum subsp. durum]|uniref:Cyanobacterial aminoacyl-tRNA synthetase CAAD domain-containing protein n=1 Tax=Triticum turgidum subsp. durum TaxID=4567 RepID=A0A9R0XAS7_TRITD|nr:unnamed protein product [Triticum turgidum subsp. durum]